MIPPFATATKHITEAYFYVMAQTTIPLNFQKKLLPTYIRADQSGDPRQRAVVLKPLIDIEWRWPIFEMWTRIFSKSNCWPYMWEKHNLISLTTSNNNEKFKLARVRLLEHTVMMSVYSCRDGYKYVSWYHRHGWRFSSINDPVEDAIAKRMKDKVELNDWRTWPPFFPGDRIGLRGQQITKTNPFILPT